MSPCLKPAIQVTLLGLMALSLFSGAAPHTFAQGAPIQLGDNTEYVGPDLWVILQRHAEGKTVPASVEVGIGYRTDLEVAPPLDEHIYTVGGERVSEYTWRVPTSGALEIIQRPDLLHMAQPAEATKGEVDPYPTMDDTLNNIVVAYEGGIEAEHAVRYAMFVWEDSVVLEMEAPAAATVGKIREWLSQQGVYVPSPSDFTAFSEDFLIALVPVSRLTALAEAFPNTYLSVSTIAGQGLPLDRAQWPVESLEFEKSVTTGFLPSQEDQAIPATVLPPTATPAAVYSTPNARHDTDGDGLIEVTNLEQLDAIRYDLDGNGTADDDSGIDVYSTAYPVSGKEVVCSDCQGYELARSLDFAASDSYASGVVSAQWTTGEGWRPIGDGWHPFLAMFNGNDHTIANLHVTPAVRTDSSSVHGFGLFGTVGEPGVVNRTGLLNASITGWDFVGPLAGANWGTISHSYATGSVSGHGCIGGLVGTNDSGLISSCHASTGVLGGLTYLGGLAGCNNRGTILASYATGSVSGDTRVGGLVGENHGWVITSYATGIVRGQKYVGGLVGSHRDGQISASYSNGDVTGGHYVGGLVGRNESIVIYTYAVGRVASDGTIDTPKQYIGGLVGYNPGIITTSYWDTESSDQRVGIGIEIGDGYSSNVMGKTTAELQSPVGYTDPYQEWDVTLGIEGWRNTPGYELSEYWDFGTGNEYPALKFDFNGDGTATWQEFGNQRRGALDPASAPMAVNCLELITVPVVTGIWSQHCMSDRRPGSYARFYTFTVTEPSVVMIDLESDDTGTHLYLLQGAGKRGKLLEDYGSERRRAQLGHTLGAGTYTIEATTHGSRQPGSFTLSVERMATSPTPTPDPPASNAMETPPPPDMFAPTALPPTPTTTPRPTSMTAPTALAMEPTYVAGPTVTATPVREPVPAREPTGTCNFWGGNSLGNTADIGIFLLAAPMLLMGWLKFGSRRRRYR